LCRISTIHGVRYCPIYRTSYLLLVASFSTACQFKESQDIKSHLITFSEKQDFIAVPLYIEDYVLILLPLFLSLHSRPVPPWFTSIDTPEAGLQNN
jgi:hypothetical protein